MFYTNMFHKYSKKEVYNFIFLKMGKKIEVAAICGWLMFVVLSPGYVFG